MDVANQIAAPGADLPGFGRFWPGGTGGVDGNFERFDGYATFGARYLPTRAALARAEAAGGCASRPLLALWERAWRSCVGDPDEHAARIGHREAWLVGPERDRTRRQDIEAMADGLSRREAAVDLCALFRDLRDDGPAREPGLHVLEDAEAVVALAGAGVPFRLVLPCLGLERPEVFAGTRTADGVPGLRRADDDEAAETLSRHPVTVGVTNPNWRSRAFLSRAGRGMCVCRGYAHVVATLADMAAQGHRLAFLKHVEVKRGTWVVDIEGARSPPAAAERLVAALGLAVADLASGEAPRDGMLVQAFVPFVNEHRFFVVDHRVVASTPSDRRLGVLGADGTRILHDGLARLKVPPGMPGRYDRGESDLVHDRALLAAMALRARDLARALRAEGRFPPHYVIDIGAAADGTVAPVEVNTLANAGRYAVDYARVARALARWYAVPRPVEAEDGYEVRIAPGFVARAMAALAAFRQPPRTVRVGRRAVMGDPDMGEMFHMLRFLVAETERHGKGKP